MDDIFEDGLPSEAEEEYDEYLYEEEPEMVAEMGAFERAGGASILGTRISASELKGKKMEDIAKHLSRISMSPQERLKIYVDALSRKLSDDGVVKIGEAEIVEMLSYVDSLKKPAFVNPIGFIMGYLASDGGRDLRVAQVKKIMGAVKRLDGEGGMTEPDVLRYSVMWEKLRQK